MYLIYVILLFSPYGVYNNITTILKYKCTKGAIKCAGKKYVLYTLIYY